MPEVLSGNNGMGSGEILEADPAPEYNFPTFSFLSPDFVVTDIEEVVLHDPAPLNDYPRFLRSGGMEIRTPKFFSWSLSFFYASHNWRCEILWCQ